MFKNLLLLPVVTPASKQIKIYHYFLRCPRIIFPLSHCRWQ